MPTIRGRLANIQRSWDADRMRDVEQFAHWLNDTVRHAGFNALIAPARRLSGLARDSQVHRITDSLTAISMLLDQLATDVETTRAAHDQAPQSQRSGSGLITLLQPSSHPHDLELSSSGDQLIYRIARAAELRSEQSGNHVMRVGRYAGIIARELGIVESDVALLEQAAQLHDVGKIAVPDAILRKRGSLDANEFEIVKRHCVLGKHILANGKSATSHRNNAPRNSSAAYNARSPLITLAACIAQTHHEKWNGSGYPLGLDGQQIPIEGRITAVADVFDSLSSRRPYKAPLPLDACFAALTAGRGHHFDPDVLDAFLARKADILKVQRELRG